MTENTPEKTKYHPTTWIIGEPSIGEDTWIGAFTVIDGSGGLKIGKHCCISSGVHIYTHDSIKWTVQNLPKKEDGKRPVDRDPVEIGDNVYVGANCTILKGVKIGNCCIIGAGAVVTKDIPSDSVALGAPARVVKKVSETKYAHEEPREK